MTTSSKVAALTAIRDGLQALIDIETAPPSSPENGAHPPTLTTAQTAMALAASGQPSVSVGAVQAPVGSKMAYVPVSLSKPAIWTTYVSIMTRNGTGAGHADQGFQYKATSASLTFKPGDPLVQWLAVPLLSTMEGGHFDVIIPTTPQGCTKGPDGSVTFTAATQAQTVPPAYAATSKRVPQKGALVYQFDPATFQASPAGGLGVYRTSFHDGIRTQDGNGEIGYYTDPTLNPGTKPFEIRNGQLVLRAEKFATPLSVTIGGVPRTYGFGSCVLQANWLSQQYGYYEWDCMLPSAPGTWEGLWLLPSSGGWPPEIDVSESPRNGGFGPGDTSASIHSSAGSETLQLDMRAIMGDPTLDLTKSFHKRAVDWRADWTTIYFDDVEVARFPTIFHEPAFPLMDVTVGGWGGTPNLTTGSAELVIRSFKVFA